MVAVLNPERAGLGPPQAPQPEQFLPLHKPRKKAPAAGLQHRKRRLPGEFRARIRIKFSQHCVKTRAYSRERGAVVPGQRA